MRGFFSITRSFIAPMSKQFKVCSQQQRLQTRLMINRIMHMMRMSTSMQGLRFANVYDLNLLSLLEEAQDDSTDLDARQIGLHGCTLESSQH